MQGRWLLLARGIWITLVILTLAIFFANLPVYIAQLQTPFTVAVSVSVPYLMFPVAASPGSLYPLAYNQVGILLGFCIPLSFGFAMLRSRL